MREQLRVLFDHGMEAVRDFIGDILADIRHIIRHLGVVLPKIGFVIAHEELPVSVFEPAFASLQGTCVSKDGSE
jgi:hypothetical protein